MDNESLNAGINETRGIDFDQSVDELSQLEKESEKNPENEKIKRYLVEVREHIDKLLKELEDETDYRPSVKLGEQAVKNVSAESLTKPGDDRIFVDSQGNVSHDPNYARQDIGHWTTGDQ